MGVYWTTKEQRNHLKGYRQQFAEVQSSTSARTAFIDKVLKEYEAKWGVDTWNFNGLEFEGTEDKVLDSKRGKMFDVSAFFPNSLCHIYCDLVAHREMVLQPFTGCWRLYV